MSNQIGNIKEDDNDDVTLVDSILQIVKKKISREKANVKSLIIKYQDYSKSNIRAYSFCGSHIDKSSELEKLQLKNTIEIEKWLENEIDILVLHSEMSCDSVYVEKISTLISIAATKSKLILLMIDLGNSEEFDNYQLLNMIGDVLFYDELLSPKEAVVRRRKVIFISNSYILIDRNLIIIEQPLSQIQIHKPNGKFYYLCEESMIAKVYRNSDYGIDIELRRENEFIKEYNTMKDIPKPVFYSENKYRIIQVNKANVGYNLQELIIKKQNVDYERIFDDVIVELQLWESKGWFHRDIRAWNICIDKTDGHAFLIDYGSFSRVNIDVNGDEYNCITM